MATQIPPALLLFLLTLPFIPFLIVSVTVSIWILTISIPFATSYAIYTVLRGAFKAIWGRNIKPLIYRLFGWSPTTVKTPGGSIIERHEVNDVLENSGHFGLLPLPPRTGWNEDGAAKWLARARNEAGASRTMELLRSMEVPEEPTTSVRTRRVYDSSRGTSQPEILEGNLQRHMSFSTPNLL